jgi:hypothetical protein
MSKSSNIVGEVGILKGSTDKIIVADEIVILKKELDGIKTELKKESIRLIELLSFFISAISLILAIIVLTTKDISVTNLRFIMLALPIILLLFNISGSLFLRLDIDDPKRTIKIILLIFLMVLLIGLNCLLI